MALGLAAQLLNLVRTEGGPPPSARNSLASLVLGQNQLYEPPRVPNCGPEHLVAHDQDFPLPRAAALRQDSRSAGQDYAEFLKFAKPGSLSRHPQTRAILGIVHGSG